MRQILILSLYILLVLFGLSKGADDNATLYSVMGCVIDGIDDVHFLMGYDNPQIRDDFRGVTASFATKDVYSVEISGTNYFNVSFESDNLQIFTTDAFKNIEPEIGYEPLPMIRFQLEFRCVGGSVGLRFTQPLIDINNHDPYFGKEVYDYIYVQNSLPSLYHLTDDQALGAFDIDMTNYKVSFSIETNDYFAITETTTDSTTRQTLSRLTSLRIIEAPSSIKLNISATDIREPTRTSTAVLEVYILLESDGEVPIPEFSDETYTVSYEDGELIFNDEIRLANGIGYLANITQIGYEDYFRVTFANRAEGVLRIELLQPLSNLPETVGDSIQFQIQLFNDGSSQPAVTTVTVNVPRNSTDEVISCSDRPILSKHAYLARYINGYLDFEDEIRIISDDHSNLTITQTDWNNYFKPTLINEEILITVVNPLPEAILANNTFILFDIEVAKNNNTSYSTGAAILIQLPPISENNETLSFEHNTYVAVYNGDMALTFQKQILLIGNVNTVIMRMQNSNYTDYFYVMSPVPNMVTIDLIKPLNRNSFDNGIIVFDILALSSDSFTSATASVVVVWDEPETVLVLVSNYPLSFVFIIILLAIFIAISAAIGFKLIFRKRCPPPPSPSELPPPSCSQLPPPSPSQLSPPPYTFQCEKK